MPLLERTLRFIARHERPISVAATIGGFCFDYIIAKRPDTIFVNALLLCYLLVSASIIIFLNRPHRRSAIEPVSNLAPILTMKFAFGGLASNLLILYGKSGTPAGSIIFLALLLSMLIGNEFIKSRYEQLRFNVSVLFVLLLTYCIIAVPTWLTHSVGTAAFLISGAISAAVMLVFLLVLHLMTPVFRGAGGRRSASHVLLMIVGTLAFFDAMYFAQIIPPVPIALRDSGIYHSIVRQTDGSYRATYEAPARLAFLESTSDVYTLSDSGDAYCFSSVFAPTGLSTGIRHRWEKYDAAADGWNTVSIVSFPISGGREEGYRGYSVKRDVDAGSWRCSVETSSGRLIGRVSFIARAAAAAPILSERAL